MMLSDTEKIIFLVGCSTELVQLLEEGDTRLYIVVKVDKWEGHEDAPIVGMKLSDENFVEV